MKKTGIETILGNDGILQLNKKHIEEGLDHRKHKYELVEEPKKQYNRISIYKKLAIKVIMDSRTTSAQKFRTRSRFTQYDVILTNEQSVLTKKTSFFTKKNCANRI